MTVRYPKLFSPLRLGTLTLPNRAVVAALTTNFADPEGNVTDNLVEYLAARARGGFGLVITENIGVDPVGRVSPKMVMGHEDRFIRGLARIALRVHEEGGIVFGQASHAGRQTTAKSIGSLQPVAPSPIPCPLARVMPRELTIPEIEELEGKFAETVRRLRDAGFDGAEIHGAHGYLVAGFLSPYSNHRTDAYGGDREGRTRFLRNILAKARALVGPDFPIIVRMSAWEAVEGGNDPAEVREIARLVEGAGAAAIDVSAGVYASFNRVIVTTSGTPFGVFAELAAEIKKGVSVPVITVGRITTARLAEQILSDGKADLVAFGRASMADPDLPRKSREGREAEVVPCIGCNCCLGRTRAPEAVCPTNPELGHEIEWAPRRASVPRRVAVVGSGVPGLHAARVAAERGHKVSVFEPGPYVGGLQALRARVPAQAEVGLTIDYLLRRLGELGVKIRREAFPLGNGFDAVWNSAAPQFKLPVEGVPPGMVVRTAPEVLAQPPEGKTGLAAVWGGNLLGSETALYLSSLGWEVVVLCLGKKPAFDAHTAFREIASRSFSEHGIRAEEGGAIPPDATLFVLAEGEGDPAGVALPGEPLGDAYEPWALTEKIYAATARARNL